MNTDYFVHLNTRRTERPLKLRRNVWTKEMISLFNTQTCSAEMSRISCRAFSMPSLVPVMRMLALRSSGRGIAILVAVLSSSSCSFSPFFPITKRWCSFGMVTVAEAYASTREPFRHWEKKKKSKRSGACQYIVTWVWSRATISFRAFMTESSFPVTMMERPWSLARESSMWAPVFCMMSKHTFASSPSPNWLLSLYRRSSNGTWNT